MKNIERDYYVLPNYYTDIHSFFSSTISFWQHICKPMEMWKDHMHIISFICTIYYSFIYYNFFLFHNFNRIFPCLSFLFYSYLQCHVLPLFKSLLLLINSCTDKTIIGTFKQKKMTSILFRSCLLLCPLLKFCVFKNTQEMKSSEQEKFEIKTF